MFNGCQILISTPRFLARFLDENKKLLNFQNLRYLILDGGDVILDKYFDSVNILKLLVITLSIASIIKNIIFRSVNYLKSITLFVTEKINITRQCYKL